MKRQLFFLGLCCLLTKANAQNDPSATVGDTGTVTFNYMGGTVTYTTVRGADGLIWLQQNLGATQVATSSTDANAYGHYFQWGRWDDGHQVSTSTTVAASTITPNNPLGIPMGNVNFISGNNPGDWWSAGSNNNTWANAAPSSNNGTDPCAAIGTGWHLPTQAEFANAVTVEGISDTASAFASNLRLTASGSREPIFGTMINLGTYGQYWTATPSNQYGKNVTILDNAINVSDDGLRSYGMNLRCITTCTGVFAPDTINGADTVCMGTTNTYSVPAVNNANSYSWTVPTGWTIVGANNGSSINVMAGSTGGTITAKAVNNCDSSAAISLNVAVNPLPVPVITQSGWNLNTGTFSSYQWLVNDTIITGATTNPYTASMAGPYKVIVTDANGCSDTSVVYNVAVSVATVPGAEMIQMYPNPATTVLNISSPFAVDVVIYSIDGRLAATAKDAQRVDISGLGAGLYQVKLTDSEGRVVKMEKLVVLPK